MPYCKMPSLLPTTRVHFRHPDSSLHTIHVDVNNALDAIYTATNALETKFPKALFFVAGDFNQSNLKRALPKYHQHISCPTRGPNILGHCYTTIKDTYHSIPCPHFRKSHHCAVFLLPAYKQKVKQENPSRNEVQCWSEAAEVCLQDCSDSMGWSVLKCSAENLDDSPPPSQTSLANVWRTVYQRSRSDAFYGQFEQNASGAVPHAPKAPDTPVPSVNAADARLVFVGVNPRKAMGPDGIPGRALRSCVGQLT
eukprot:g44321.t1